jgi:hypothetical protein
MGFFQQVVNRCTGGGRVERFCTQLGWPIDERDDDGIGLYFEDSVVGRRTVYIHGEDDELVAFVAMSHAILPQREVTPEMVVHLLQRNRECLPVAWSMRIGQDGRVGFVLQYLAFGEGLSAAGVKYVCQKLVAEAAEFDAKMKRAGLLR